MEKRLLLGNKVIYTSLVLRASRDVIESFRIEEPSSPSPPEGNPNALPIKIEEISTTSYDKSKDMEYVELKDASETMDDQDVEAEFEKIVNKRKIVAEEMAERKARRIHERFRREGLSLSQVVDEIAKDHGELHEKATVIRLSFEEEALKFRRTLEEEVELPFDYGLDAVQTLSPPSSIFPTPSESFSLDTLQDPVTEDPVRSSLMKVSVSPPQCRKPFVSPTAKHHINND